MATRFELSLRCSRTAANWMPGALFEQHRRLRGTAVLKTRWRRPRRRQQGRKAHREHIRHTRPSGAFRPRCIHTHRSQSMARPHGAATIQIRVAALKKPSARGPHFRGPNGERSQAACAHASSLRDSRATTSTSTEEPSANSLRRKEGPGRGLCGPAPRLGRAKYFNFWMFGETLENQWEYIRLPQVVPMLGDAGAHVGFLPIRTPRRSYSATSPVTGESIRSRPLPGSPGNLPESSGSKSVASTRLARRHQCH